MEPAVQPGSKVMLLTGGGWWSTTPANVGTQFLIQTFKHRLEASSGDAGDKLIVYVCTRSPPPAGALEEFVMKHKGAQSKTSLQHLSLDLADPSSIRSCASTFTSKESRLYCLVLNAAVFVNQRKTLSRAVTLPSGAKWPVEQTFGTNVLGNALLMKELLPTLRRTAESMSRVRGDQVKVVMLSSELHEKCKGFNVRPENIEHLFGPEKWNGMNTYKLTKLIQTIYAYGLRLALKDEGINVVTATPGFVPSTGLARDTNFAVRAMMQYILPLFPFTTSPAAAGQKIWEAAFAPSIGLSHDSPHGNEDGDGTGKTVEGEELEKFYYREFQCRRASAEVYDSDIRSAWMVYLNRAIEEWAERGVMAG